MTQLLKIFLVGTVLWPQIVLATSPSSQGFTLDTERLEQEEELKVGQQSDYLQGLFQSEVQDQLEAKQLQANQQFQVNQASLFTSSLPASTDIYHQNQLFLGQGQKTVATRVEGAEFAGSGLAENLYLGLGVLILSAATVASYRLSQEDT